MSNRLPFTFDESFKISLNAKVEKKKTPKWSPCACCSCECGGQKVKNVLFWKGAISFQMCSLLRCSVGIYQKKKKIFHLFGLQSDQSQYYWRNVWGNQLFQGNKPTKWRKLCAARLLHEQVISYPLIIQNNTCSVSVLPGAVYKQSAFCYTTHFCKWYKSFQPLKDAAECCAASLSALCVAFLTGTCQSERGGHSARGNKARGRVVL